MGAGRRLLYGLILAASSCRTAVNYPDPAGPWYDRTSDRPPPAVTDTLRVVTFNIEFAKHVDRAITVLRESAPLQRPDLLVLQEMDAEGVRQIADAFDLNALYAPGGVHPTPRHDFGVALLSPWPLVDRRKIVLPHRSRGTHLQKAIVGATLVMGDRHVRVYGVHLPSPLAVSSHDRHEQVDTLLADARDATDPILIAGDLNSHGIGARFEKAGYLWLTRHVGVTAVEMTVFRLSYDHVFVKGLVPAPGTAAGVVADNHQASDHRPVWAVLRWP